MRDGGEVLLQEAKKIESTDVTNRKALFRFFGLSSLGIFGFFIPVTIQGKSSIPIDHIVSFLQSELIGILPYYVLILVIIGVLQPFYSKTWNKNKINTVMTFLKVIGALFILMVILNIGPSWLLREDMGPFIFKSLIFSVVLILPIGALFLTMLIGYGLLEFIGIFLQPIMRPIFKTPGRSALDAIASFVASYGLGLLLTNKVFLEGKYTIKEANIIATGFSTASVAFMVIMIQTLDLMDYWNMYFWVTLIVSFTVTAITVRIWPLRSLSEEYIKGEGDPETEIKKGKFKEAWRLAMQTAQEALPLHKNLWINLKEGYMMVIQLTPLLMSIGLIGLLLAEYTLVFDVLGYIFVPITWALQIPEPLLAAKAASIGIAELFLPTLLVVEAPLITKFIIASVSYSAVIFFSGTIPTILATRIPISVTKLIVIWFLRTIIAFIIVTPIALILLR